MKEKGILAGQAVDQGQLLVETGFIGLVIRGFHYLCLHSVLTFLRLLQRYTQNRKAHDKNVLEEL